MNLSNVFEASARRFIQSVLEVKDSDIRKYRGGFLSCDVVCKLKIHCAQSLLPFQRFRLGQGSFLTSFSLCPPTASSTTSEVPCSVNLGAVVLELSSDSSMPVPAPICVEDFLMDCVRDHILVPSQLLEALQKVTHSLQIYANSVTINLGCFTVVAQQLTYSEKNGLSIDLLTVSDTITTVKMRIVSQDALSGHIKMHVATIESNDVPSKSFVKTALSLLVKRGFPVPIIASINSVSLSPQEKFGRVVPLQFDATDVIVTIQQETLTVQAAAVKLSHAKSRSPKARDSFLTNASGMMLSTTPDLSEVTIHLKDGTNARVMNDGFLEYLRMADEVGLGKCLTVTGDILNTEFHSGHRFSVRGFVRSPSQLYADNIVLHGVVSFQRVKINLRNEEGPPESKLRMIQCHKMTILLDELDALPPSLSAELPMDIFVRNIEKRSISGVWTLQALHTMRFMRVRLQPCSTFTAFIPSRYQLASSGATGRLIISTIGKSESVVVFDAKKMTLHAQLSEVRVQGLHSLVTAIGPGGWFQKTDISVQRIILHDPSAQYGDVVGVLEKFRHEFPSLDCEFLSLDIFVSPSCRCCTEIDWDASQIHDALARRGLQHIVASRDVCLHQCSSGRVDIGSLSCYLTADSIAALSSWVHSMVYLSKATSYNDKVATLAETVKERIQLDYVDRYRSVVDRPAFVVLGPSDDSMGLRQLASASQQCSQSRAFSEDGECSPQVSRGILSSSTVNLFIGSLSMAFYSGKDFPVNLSIISMEKLWGIRPDGPTQNNVRSARGSAPELFISVQGIEAVMKTDDNRDPLTLVASAEAISVKDVPHNTKLTQVPKTTFAVEWHQGIPKVYLEIPPAISIFLRQESAAQIANFAHSVWSSRFLVALTRNFMVAHFSLSPTTVTFDYATSTDSRETQVAVSTPVSYIASSCNLQRVSVHFSEAPHLGRCSIRTAVRCTWRHMTQHLESAPFILRCLFGTTIMTPLRSVYNAALAIPQFFPAIQEALRGAYGRQMHNQLAAIREVAAPGQRPPQPSATESPLFRSCDNHDEIPAKPDADSNPIHEAPGYRVPHEMTPSMAAFMALPPNERLLWEQREHREYRESLKVMQQQQEEARKQEAAATRKALEDEMARQKKEYAESLARKKAEEEKARHRAAEELAAARRAYDEAIARKRAEDEAAAKAAHGVSKMVQSIVDVTHCERDVAVFALELYHGDPNRAVDAIFNEVLPRRPSPNGTCL